MAEHHAFRVVHPETAAEVEAMAQAAESDTPPIKKGFLALILAPLNAQEVPRPTETRIELLVGRTTYEGGDAQSPRHISIIEGAIPASPTVLDATITFPEDTTQQAILEVTTVDSMATEEDL